MKKETKETITYKKEIDKIFKTIFKGLDVDESKKLFFQETGFTYENINSSIEGAIENGFTLKYQINNLIRIFKREMI